MTVVVDVELASGAAAAPAADEIVRWVRRAVVATGRDADFEVSVRIVNEDEMQALNREFRGKDNSTNVLSFPAVDIMGLPADTQVPLGDIVVCAAIVIREAATQGKLLADHWAHMLVHGTLHLLGYDHVLEADAMAMESLEIQVLNQHGVENPYGESLSEN